MYRGAKPQQAWLEQSPKEIYIVNVTPPRQEVSSARFQQVIDALKAVNTVKKLPERPQGLPGGIYEIEFIYDTQTITYGFYPFEPEENKEQNQYAMVYSINQKKTQCFQVTEAAYRQVTALLETLD